MDNTHPRVVWGVFLLLTVCLACHEDVRYESGVELGDNGNPESGVSDDTAENADGLALAVEGGDRIVADFWHCLYYRDEPTDNHELTLMLFKPPAVLPIFTVHMSSVVPASPFAMDAGERGITHAAVIEYQGRRFSVPELRDAEISLVLDGLAGLEGSGVDESVPLRGSLFIAPFTLDAHDGGEGLQLDSDVLPVECNTNSPFEEPFMVDG